MVSGCKKKKVLQERLCSRIDLEQIVSLIPTNSQDVYLLAQQTRQLMDEMFAKIDQIPAEQRTYLNTVLEYEKAYFQFYTHQQVLQVLSKLCDDNSLQTAANVALLELGQYANQMLTRNVTLFQALQEYQKFGKDPYRHTKPVVYFLEEMSQRFAKESMKLSVAQRADVAKLEQEINQQAGKFYSNASYDRRHIIVSDQELTGIPQDFLATLSQDDDGNYIVPADGSTYDMIMQNCLVESTRRTYYVMFGQIGYPANESVLQSLIAKRQQLAQLIGFDSFAAYQLDSLMIKTPKKADAFLWSMVKDLQPYDDRDFAQLIRNLPPSVTLTSQHKLKPWDEPLVKAWYRKQHFKIDEEQVCNYFELQHVLSEIIKSFSQFFHVEFEPQKIEGLWSEDLVCYRIRTLKHQGVLGYMFFDLHKRTSKRDTAEYELTMIPAIRDDCSSPCVGAVVVAANFAKATEEKPTLLTLNQVMSLLQEMGRGMHAIFGATRFTQFAGTQVVYDFEQVPSQMLRYWFDDPEFLKRLGRHWQTGKPMSAAMIEQLIAAQKFGRAGAMLQQLFLGLVSLHLFEQDHQDAHTLIEKLYKKVFKHLAYEPEHYFEMSFLTLAQQNYSTAYYSSALSEVIAADFFAYIKPHGLFNYEVGSQYITEILSPGGSRHPAEMIKRFLGRSFHKKSYLEQL